MTSGAAAPPSRAERTGVSHSAACRDTRGAAVVASSPRAGVRTGDAEHGAGSQASSSFGDAARSARDALPGGERHGSGLTTFELPQASVAVMTPAFKGARGLRNQRLSSSRLYGVPRSCRRPTLLALDTRRAASRGHVLRLDRTFVSLRLSKTQNLFHATVGSSAQSECVERDRRIHSLSPPSHSVVAI